MQAPVTAVVFSIFFALLSAWAQDPSSHADSRSPSVTHQQRNPRNLGLTLSGTVLLGDGNRPSEPVQVELFCNGRIRRQTLTSPGGSFSIEVGSPRSEDWLDPSVGGSHNGSIASLGTLAPASDAGDIDEVPGAGRGRMDLSGCEVRASPRPGYSSESIRLRARSIFDNPNLGTLIVRKLSSSASTTVSLNTLEAPDSARKEFDEALEKLRAEEQDFEKISEHLEKALEEFESFSAAWDLLGRIEASRGEYAKAGESFLKAVEHEPGFISPYLGLAKLAIQESDWEKVGQWSSRILDLDLHHPQGLYWDGLANYYTSNFAAAEESLSALYKQPERIEAYPFGLLPLGVIHANQGKITEAARELSLYLEQMPEEQIPDAQRDELSRQLTVWREQGLLDSKENADNEIGNSGLAGPPN